MYETDEFEKKQISDIGEFFAQLRYKKNKTQRQMAQLFDMSQTTITHFEAGKINFHFQTLQRLAKFHGYRVEVALVPIAEGIDTRVVARPNPDDRSARKYDGNKGRKYPNRRKPKAKPKRAKVVYKEEDDFDIAAEMAVLRQNLGV